MKISISDPQLIYCAPINELTQKWGVYCLPRLWRQPDNSLLIRFNGEIDTPSADWNCLPSLYFKSTDNGASWTQLNNIENIDTSILRNVEIPLLKEENKTICIKGKNFGNLKQNFKPCKIFSDGFEGSGNKYYVYKQGDLLKSFFALERIIYDDKGNVIDKKDAFLDFDERELLFYGECSGIKQEISFQANICYSPYITSIKKLNNKELIGLCSGQNQHVNDRYCTDLYLVFSNDNGLTWHKRSTITKNSEKYKFGLVGDGCECSLDISQDGIIYVVTRTDMSCDHQSIGGTTDTMLFTSNDNGFTWSNERSVSDSSITPHVLCFGKNIVVVIYGRPGVHLKVSKDGGRTFGKPISIIGKTLTGELKCGKTYMDAKYFDTSSYSNSFVEKISNNEFIILYNDLKYDNGDGLNHKAGLIKKVKINF